MADRHVAEWDRSITDADKSRIRYKYFGKLAAGSRECRDKPLLYCGLSLHHVILNNRKHFSIGWIDDGHVLLL